MGKTFSDMEFDLFEFDDRSQVSHSLISKVDDDVDDEEGHKEIEMAETKAFWDAQHQLLHEALSRRSSTEMRIQRDTEEVLTKMQSAGKTCTCFRECRQHCLLREVVDRLRDLGYNSAQCKSKWQNSPDAPSGVHNYIDVIMEAKNERSTRSIIEMNFRTEFEMARANSEYNRLVSSLPVIFVGKSEKLKNVIRIMCSAAKKCMKENKMHMAPWRKHKYMQSKWLGTSERITASQTLSTVQPSSDHRPLRPQTSMLSFDMHLPAVNVV